MSIALPHIPSPKLKSYENLKDTGSTDLIQLRAVHLNSAVVGVALGGGWRAYFQTISTAMPAGIAVTNLESLYQGVMQLTQAGQGPIHQTFQFVLGSLELVLETADPSTGIPWDLVCAFAIQARARSALGLAGLYRGRLQSTAGQAVIFALQLRTRSSLNPDMLGREEK